MALRKKAAINVHVHVLVWTPAAISLGRTPRDEMLLLRPVHVSLLGTALLFPSWAYRTSYIPPAMYEGSNFSTSLPTLGIVCFFILAILLGVKWCLVVVLISIPLKTTVVEHLLSACFLIICKSSLEKCLFTSFDHF